MTELAIFSLITASILGQRLTESLVPTSGKYMLKTFSGITKLVPFATIGFGIWDIIDGTTALKEAGISSNILLKAKQLSHRLTSLVANYDEIIGMLK